MDPANVISMYANTSPFTLHSIINSNCEIVMKEGKERKGKGNQKGFFLLLLLFIYFSDLCTFTQTIADQTAPSGSVGFRS